MLSYRPAAAAAVLAAALAAPLAAQTAREVVYFTTPNNKISRALFATGTSQVAVVDNGTNFNGLAVRYDGNGVVTLIAANATAGGDIRAYRCPSATEACQSLGVVGSLKKVAGVALDVSGNLYAINSHKGGADQLVYAERKVGCPTDSGAGLPAGCVPGGYAPLVVVDSQVDGASELADVKVEAASGDVIVLASSPAMLLRYAAGDVAERVDDGGPEPTPTPVPASFHGHEPSGLALFPTGEIFVVTRDGYVKVFQDGALNLFTSLAGGGSQIAIGAIGGAAADPVADGRVLVTAGGRVLSFGIDRVGGKLVASPSVPDGSVEANAPFGVGDASLGGAVYTPASAGAQVVKLAAGHEVTFERVNAAGLTQGNYYVVPETTVRSAPTTGACGAGEALTLEGLTRCVPSYLRGYSQNGSVCQSNGVGCFYLVYVADSGANVFGSTQQHHFEEDEFGFATNCYVGASATAAPDPKQPRTFHATDANDPSVVEGDDFFDISTGCGSHIGRGGEFSMFVAGWDRRSSKTITTGKLDKLSLTLNGGDAFAGGLAAYVDPLLLGKKGKPNTLANDLHLAQYYWSCRNKTKTIAHLDAFINRIRTNLDKFSECPVGLPCRNAPGELVSRAESSAYLACGARRSCQRVLP